MKIYHRIGLSSVKHENTAPINKLVELKVKHKKLPQPGSSDHIYIFDAVESDSNWPHIAKIIEEYKIHSMVETSFEEKEILESEWLRLVPNFEHGYPQPENDWVTKKPNYKDVCTECGIYTQANSFHIRNEPNMKKNDFLQLFWTSAVLATIKVFNLFESNDISGYEKWPVILNKQGTPSKVVSQIYVPNMSKPGLRSQGLMKIVCQTCGVTKYYPHVSGIFYLNNGSLDPKLDFQLTAEWFGSGHMAYHEMIVSNKVARLIIENKLKGVRFKVAELISDKN